MERTGGVGLSLLYDVLLHDKEVIDTMIMTCTRWQARKPITGCSMFAVFTTSAWTRGAQMGPRFRKNEKKALGEGHLQDDPA
jgi:hypothetical protein